MQVKSIKTALNNTKLDTNANIRLIKITGDKEISVYTAEISLPKLLNPHYHQFGIEIYQIV